MKYAVSPTPTYAIINVDDMAEVHSINGFTVTE